MAGIKTLLNLLLKDAAKKSGQYSGIMSIGDSTRKLAMRKLEMYLASAQKQGVDLDKLSEDELKYIIKLNEQPKVISADTPEGRGITEALLGKRGQVIEADFGKPFAEEVKKFRGPVQTKEKMGEFGEINVGIDYSASLDNPSYFGNAKNVYGDPAKSGPEYFKEIKQFHLNQINRKKKEMVPPTHPNYKLLKKSLQDQEDSLTAAQIAEELGGNENMYDALRTKQISDPNAKPLKKSDYVKDSDPEEMAQGGRAGFAVGGLGKKLIQQIIKKYKGKIDDDLLNKMLIDDDPQRLAEVMATIDEALIMQNKGMGPEEIIGTIKSSLDRKKQADGGRTGFYMGSKFPKGLATLREMVKFFTKGKEKERTGSGMLKLLNPKQFNKMLEDPKIYNKFDIKQGIAAPDLIKNMQADMAKNRTSMVQEILGAAKNIRKADIGTMERRNQIVAEMMKRGVDRKAAEEMADTLSKIAESAVGKFDAPKLTDEGILELENILKNMETGGKDKRSLNADGGRIGLKDGMNRRTFLKLLGGLASIPIIGKIIKPLKTVKGVKNVPIIKTDNVAGKPEWFDQLVNKVIIEGDDVTKKFATAERQSIHQKTLDDGSVVRVTEDVDDGAVRVEYESPENVYGDPVQMEYKKPLPDEGNPKPTGEFTTAESGPIGRADGPDDYSIEIDEVGGTSIKDLDSDVSKLKEYATGKGPTMKEFIQNKKRKDKAARISEGGEDEMQAVIDRQGEYVQNDLVDLDPPDLASGGIARMLGE